MIQMAIFYWGPSIVCREGQNGLISGEMYKKKLCIFCSTILVIALFFSACGSKPVTGPDSNVIPTQGTEPQPTHSDQPSVTPVENIPSTQAPRVVIREEVVRNMAELVFADRKPSELMTYVDEHIAGVTPQEADKMLLILESIQKAWLDYYVSNINNNTITDPAGKKAWIEELAGNGFKYITVYNREVPLLDYGVYSKWEDSLSAWFKDYIAIVREENDAPAVKSGKLAITTEELEKRLLNAAMYVDKYPNSIRVNEVLKLYDTYLFSYLYGYENNPVINFDTGQISMSYYQRYLEFVQNNPGLEVTSIVSGYATAIEKASFMLTDELGVYLEGVFSVLDDKYIVVRNDIGRQVLMERMSMLLPERTGFTWKCFGIGEYEHTVMLEGIHTEDGNPVYTITGATGDPSGGENPDAPSSIELEYRIENNVLYQLKNAPGMIDSSFNELEIIRYPFIQGYRWYQYPEDNGINTISLQTEIISVTRENGELFYEVEYRDPATGEYEKRLIQSGKATIAFTKLYSDGQGESYEIGYFIDEDNTGYPQ